MPAMETILRYRILPELALIAEVISGQVTSEDVVYHRINQLTDWQYNVCYPRIALIQGLQLERFDIQQIKEDINSYSQFTLLKNEALIDRKAIVITPDADQTGAGTMYGKIYGDVSMQIDVVGSPVLAIDKLAIPEHYAVYVDEVFRELVFSRMEIMQPIS